MEIHKEYLQVLDLAYQVVQSRARQQEPDPRRYDCHKLAVKLYLHGATLCWLSEGTRAPVPEPGGTNCFDVGSAIVITRAALETYLRMYEIFFDAISDDEREFRHAYWLITGFIVREHLAPDELELRAKLDKTRQFLAEQRARLKGTAAFASLTRKQQEGALKGKLQAEAFLKRAKAAGFGPKTAGAMYGYYSSYAHADGLSVVQIMQAQTREEQIELMTGCLYMVMAVFSKMILEYKRTYESARAICRARPGALRLATVYAGAASQLK